MHNRSKLKWNSLFWNPCHDPIKKLHYYITFFLSLWGHRFYQIYCTENILLFVQYVNFTALQDICRENVGRKKQTQSLNHFLISCWLLGKSQSNRFFLRKLFFFFCIFGQNFDLIYISRLIFTVDKVSFSRSSPNPNNTYISFSNYIYCT